MQSCRTAIHSHSLKMFVPHQPNGNRYAFPPPTIVIFVPHLLNPAQQNAVSLGQCLETNCTRSMSSGSVEDRCCWKQKFIGQCTAMGQYEENGGQERVEQLFIIEFSELAVRMKLYKYKRNRKYMHRKLRGASKSSGLGSSQISNMSIIYYI